LNRRFLRSIAILSTGNFVAQAINFVTYLILPRYFYSPEEFGVFGLFLALYYILFEIINLKMDQSVMLPKSDDEAASLLGLSWLIASFFSVFLFIAVWIANSFLHRLEPVLPLALAFCLILGGVMQPAMVWLNRKRAYVRMGHVRVVQAVVTFVASVLGYYYLQEVINGLIFGFAAGLLAAVMVVIFNVRSVNISIANRNVIARYKQFIKFGSWSSMISTLSKNLPAFVLRNAFGDAVLGWYTLATKYLNAPIGIFSTSIGQVYFRDASTAGPEELKIMTRLVIRNILLVTIIPVLVLLFSGADIMEWFFGEQWRASGLMIQVLILWYFVAFASGPVSMLLDVKMKLKWELGYNILLLTGRALALLSAIWLKDVYYVLALYALVGIVFNGWLLNYVLKLSGQDVRTA